MTAPSPEYFDRLLAHFGNTYFPANGDYFVDLRFSARGVQNLANCLHNTVGMTSEHHLIPVMKRAMFAINSLITGAVMQEKLVPYGDFVVEWRVTDPRATHWTRMGHFLVVPLNTERPGLNNHPDRAGQPAMPNHAWSDSLATFFHPHGADHDWEFHLVGVDDRFPAHHRPFYHDFFRPAGGNDPFHWRWTWGVPPSMHGRPDEEVNAGFLRMATGSEIESREGVLIHFAHERPAPRPAFPRDPHAALPRRARLFSLLTPPLLHFEF
ncbi:hypothetical protein JCM10207_003529 [Rhodosporidiobolus poonsookiae]